MFEIVLFDGKKTKTVYKSKLSSIAFEVRRILKNRFIDNKYFIEKNGCIIA